MRIPRQLTSASVLVWVGCSSAPPSGGESASAGPPPATSVRLYLGQAWFAERGDYLGLSPEQARDRDGQFDENAAPEPAFWDEQIAQSTAVVWRVLCNECHPGKRSIARAPFIPSPSEGWPPPRADSLPRPGLIGLSIERSRKEAVERMPDLTGRCLPLAETYRASRSGPSSISLKSPPERERSALSRAESRIWASLAWFGLVGIRFREPVRGRGSSHPPSRCRPRSG